MREAMSTGRERFFNNRFKKQQDIRIGTWTEP